MSNTDFSALCHEFTGALTEILAENAVGLTRRGSTCESTRCSKEASRS